MIDEKCLYGTSLMKIPTPRFITFYNGTKEQPEKQILRLSDAFECPMEQPELELTVTMLNINLGNNQELLDTCTVLKEYMQYVTKIRTYMKEKTLEEAVKQAMDECIKEDILRDFLLKNKREAMEVCIFEYDEEATLQYIRKDEFEQGNMEGIVYSIITLLSLKGEISKELRTMISSQKDLHTLQNWLELAAKAENIKEFENLIQ